jgi:acetylornithine deacetylase/succinyl-diaminopimelate desuccinylase-like protein
MGAADLRAAVERDAPRRRAELERLVRHASVAFDGFPREPVLAAADAVEALLRDAGAADVERLEVPGDPPALLGRWPGPAGAPEVLLYAHYDVQPADPAQWRSDPWTPEVRNGRLHGRGAADDKSGIAAHLSALRAWAGRPPVGVKVLVEGGEENGRQRLLGVLGREAERLRADVLAIGDGGNRRLGEPALEGSLRGHGKLTVTVRTLEGALHSGQFGGAAPDALLALTRMLASLHDDAGDVAVAGLRDGAWAGAGIPEDEFRREARVLEGVGLPGTGPVADRIWARHAVSVLGVDAPAVAGAPNAVPAEARALVSVRVPPGAEPAASMAAVQAHVEAAAPWGARVEVAVEPASAPIAVDPGAPGAAAAERALAAAYGRPVERIGSGGSIPLVAALHAAFPEAGIVIWGAQDAGARIHAADERVDLGELGRFALAEALLLAELA